jgi:putative hydrolase of the HAD superfamily
MAERFGLEISLAAAQRAIAEEISYYRKHLQEGHDDPSVDELRGRCSHVLRQALAAEHVLDHIGADDFTQTLLAALQFRPYPEVPDVLARLRERGLRLVVASNWDASLPHTLRALDLLEQLDGVVTSAQCQAPKPEPRVFQRALELAGAGPEEALHVGDSWEEDVLGAQRIGIRPILVVRDGRPVPGDAQTIASLTQLIELPELPGGLP